MDYSGIDSKGDFFVEIVNGLPDPYDVSLYEGRIVYDTLTKKIYIGSGNGGIPPTPSSFYWRELSAGYGHSLGINESDGSAWAWGENDSGELGTSDIVSYLSPVSVLGDISFTQLASGKVYSLGLGSDGSAWAWGDNSYGQLGTGDMDDYSSPVLVLGEISFKQIIIGIAETPFSLGLDGSDGTGWAWGFNGFGQLGTGNMESYSSPVSVLGGISFVQISAGKWHCLGLDGSDGTAWAWGINTSGQLGTGNVIYYSSPVSVQGDISYKQILAGKFSSLGIRGSDGSAWAWGWNIFGQLGTGNAASYSSPVSVLGGISFKQVSAGISDFFVGIRGSDGSAWAWGYNDSGQLGTGNMESYSSPVSVLGSVSFKQISAGKFHCLGIRGSDGTGWAWGYNYYGQLGTGNATSYSSPASVLGGISFTQISYGLGLATSLGIRGSDGTAWAWGKNDYGQLGNGNTTNYSSPVSVVGGISWKQVAAGYLHTLGIRGSDGTAWAWGVNNYGQLGTGNATSYSSPVSVLGGISFTQLTAGQYSSLGIRGLDSIGLSWGWNSFGELGNNTRTNYSSPVLIG